MQNLRRVAVPRVGAHTRPARTQSSQQLREDFLVAPALAWAEINLQNGCACCLFAVERNGAQLRRSRCCMVAVLWMHGRQSLHGNGCKPLLQIRGRRCGRSRVAMRSGRCQCCLSLPELIRVSCRCLLVLRGSNVDPGAAEIAGQTSNSSCPDCSAPTCRDTSTPCLPMPIVSCA